MSMTCVIWELGFCDVINVYPYLKCTALIFVFPPMKLLMFSAAVKGFMTACAPLGPILTTISYGDCSKKLDRFL